MSQARAYETLQSLKALQMSTHINHRVFIIVRGNRPMNEYQLFCNPPGSVKTFNTEAQAESFLRQVRVGQRKTSDIMNCRIVPATLSWEKIDE